MEKLRRSNGEGERLRERKKEGGMKIERGKEKNRCK